MLLSFVSSNRPPHLSPSSCSPEKTGVGWVIIPLHPGVNSVVCSLALVTQQVVFAKRWRWGKWVSKSRFKWIMKAWELDTVGVQEPTLWLANSNGSSQNHWGCLRQIKRGCYRKGRPFEKGCATNLIVHDELKSLPVPKEILTLNYPLQNVILGRIRKIGTRKLRGKMSDFYFCDLAFCRIELLWKPLVKRKTGPLQ